MAAPRHGRWRRAFADAIGLFLLPALLAALPWSLAWRLLRRMAATMPTFRREADAACSAAQAIMPVPDPETWKRNYRLVRWIERCDTFLTLLRSRRWWFARIDIEGAWPSPGQPCLFLTFHWGAGHWVWRCLQAAGFDAYFVARRPEATDLGAGRLALWYGRLRGWGFAHVGGLGVLYTGGSRRRIDEALRAGSSILGMLDLPSHHATRTVNLLGRPMRLPYGLLECTDVPCSRAIISCAVDLRDGRRRLRIEPLDPHTDVDTLLQRYAAHLDARLHESPESWMMWHEAPAMFVQAPEPVDAAPDDAGGNTR